VLHVYIFIGCANSFTWFVSSSNLSMCGRVHARSWLIVKLTRSFASETPENSDGSPTLGRLSRETRYGLMTNTRTWVKHICTSKPAYYGTRERPLIFQTLSKHYYRIRTGFLQNIIHNYLLRSFTLSKTIVHGLNN